MAQGASVNRRDLSGYRGISTGGAIWIDRTDSPFVLLDSCEFGGGLREKRRSRFCAVCSIAMGSASELEYHLLLARDLGLITEPVHHDLAQRVIEVKRMLTSLRQKLTTEN